MAAGLHPCHPIIYVRGFAATQTDIEDTVADPGLRRTLRVEARPWS